MPLTFRQKVALKIAGFSQPQILSIQKSADSQGYFYTISGNSSTIRDCSTVTGQTQAYNQCPPVSGIINREAKAFLNGQWWLMDGQGNESKTQTAKALRALFNRPNILQSWSQFLLQAYVFNKLYGECFILALHPTGFEDNPLKAKSLWVIPNWMMTVTTSGKMFYQSELNEIITKYELSENGRSIPIDSREIIHLKDIHFNTTDIVKGQSRLAALTDPVSNIAAAYEARNVLITRKGALGILSNSSEDVAGGMMPIEQKEKEEIQAEFSKYGMSKSQWQVIVTSAALKWQPMSFPTKDLMLFEEIEDDVRQICDNYDFPMYLLGFKSGSTFNNVGEAKKSLYQDCIIPESGEWVNAFSNYFKLAEQGIELQISFDHIEVLQRSEKDKAEAKKMKAEGMKILYELKVITREEYREAMEYDPTKFNGNTFYEGKSTNTITVE